MLALPMHARADETQPRIFFAAKERLAIAAQRLRVRQEAGAAPGEVATDSIASAHGSSAESSRVEGIAVGTHAMAAAWIGKQRYVDGTRFGPYRVGVDTQGVTLTDASGASRLVRVNQPVRVTAASSLAAPTPEAAP
jgi:hypothetical protein